MAAVALTTKDEQVLVSLQKLLNVASKSQVIHLALQALQQAVNRQHLAKRIKESVKKCGKADLGEHYLLTGASILRLDDK